MSELINSLNCSITSSAIAIVILVNAFTIVSDFDDSYFPNLSLLLTASLISLRINP